MTQEETPAFFLSEEKTMAIIIGLKLQTPTIELPVIARDAAGVTESIKIGFKRYSVEETRKKFDQLKDIQDRITEQNPGAEELDDFIRNEVVYVKGANIEVTDDETGKSWTVTVADSRTVKPVEALWKDSEECVSLLLTAYLLSAPYRVSILDSMSRAFLNNDYNAAKAGN